jgi:hypothetical protein
MPCGPLSRDPALDVGLAEVVGHPRLDRSLGALTNGLQSLVAGLSRRSAFTNRTALGTRHEVVSRADRDLDVTGRRQVSSNGRTRLRRRFTMSVWQTVAHCHMPSAETDTGPAGWDSGRSEVDFDRGCGRRVGRMEFDAAAVRPVLDDAGECGGVGVGRGV